jgi:O-antigen/teichoic acid export membrane protein
MIGESKRQRTPAAQQEKDPQARTTSVKRLALTNGLWASVQQGLFLGSNALLTVMLARTLTVGDYGTYTYAITVASFGLAIMTAGISSLGVKSLVGAAASAAVYVPSLIVIRELFALAGYVLILLLALVTDNSTSAIAVAFAGLVLFARALDAPEMWFSAEMRGGTPARIRIAVTAIFLGLRVAAFFAGASISVFVAAFVFESLAASTWILLRYLKTSASPGLARPSRQYSRRMLRSSWPLMLSSLANQVNLRGDVVVIQALTGSAAVGVYGVASRVSEIAFFLPVVFMNATFPLLLQTRKEFGQGSRQYLRFLQASYDRAFWLGCLISVLVLALGPTLVPLVFGERYTEAVPVLSIQVLACPFVFMAAVFSKWIVAEGTLWVSLVRHATAAGINIVLNIALIPPLGLRGAALATLASYVMASYLSCFLTKGTRLAGKQMTLAMIAPVRLLANRKYHHAK